MHPFDLHPEFYNKPILLTEEELVNPILVIQQFYDDVRLIEVRQNLANLLEVAVTTDNSFYSDATKRDTVLCFCKQLEKMVEAALLILN